MHLHDEYGVAPGAIVGAIADFKRFFYFFNCLTFFLFIFCSVERIWFCSIPWFLVSSFNVDIHLYQCSLPQLEKSRKTNIVLNLLQCVQNHSLKVAQSRSLGWLYSNPFY